MSMLASYAASDENSCGRVYPEENPQFRSQYQRDRDRIIHSSAFRRLEYKTQVFLSHEGDMFRTRLTHSIEVAQIGRTVARALHVNEDLTEAICLAHDLGHTPFGHAGQDALNNCMKEHGGFEHNLQSLRVVDVLERKYAEFPGLNLTYETREGILKHCSIRNAKTLGELGLRFIDKTRACLEAQIANIADEIAYNNHDVDDGLRAGLISLEDLRNCEIIEEHYRIVISRWPGLSGRRLIYELIRGMINSLVTDLINTSSSNIETAGVRSVKDVRRAKREMVRLGGDMQGKHDQLKSFLRGKLYNHRSVREMGDKSRNIIRALFDFYVNSEECFNTGSLQGEYQGKLESGEETRITDIKDYIAGMTDRFAMMEFDRIVKSNC